MIGLKAFGMSMLAWSSNAAASAPPPLPETDEIVVTGFSKPYKLTGKQLATAARVYRKYRPGYAPQAKLLFQVASKGRRDLSGLKLFLQSKNASIPVVLDEAARFVLPELAAGDWTLVANRGSGSLQINPLVLSPGTTEADRTLGDMRLQCEVTWAAFVKPELPLVVRGLVAPFNACRRSDFALYQSVTRPIASVSILSGDVLKPVKLGKGGTSFRYPGYDKTLPHSARVRFRY